MINRKINTIVPQETDEEENQGVGDSFPDSDQLVARAELSISINEASEEEKTVVTEFKKIYDLGEKAEVIMLKKVDFKRLNAAVQRVNNVLRFFETSNIAETNNLIVASSVWVSRKQGLKRAIRDGKTKSEPWWYRRIEDSIKELYRNMNLLSRHKNGEMKSKRKVENLYEKFRIRQKCLGTVLEELKNREFWQK